MSEGKITMHEDVLVVVERGEQGMPELSINATFSEMFSITMNMVSAMSNASGLEYNDILDDMKEVDTTTVSSNIKGEE